MDEFVSFKDAHAELTVAQLNRLVQQHATKYEPVDFGITLFDVRGKFRMGLKSPAATYRAAVALAMMMCHRFNLNNEERTSPEFDPYACAVDGEKVAHEVCRFVEDEAGVMSYEEFIKRFRRTR